MDGAYNLKSKKTIKFKMDGRKKLNKLKGSFTRSIIYILVFYFILILVEAIFFSEAHNGFFNSVSFALSVLISLPGLIGTVILWIVVGSVIFIINLWRKR